MTKLARAIDDEANMGHMAKLNHAMFFEQLKKITLTGEVVFWDRQDAAPKGANLASPLCAIFLFQTCVFFRTAEKITLTGMVVFWAGPNAFLTTFGDHFPSF